MSPELTKKLISSYPKIFGDVNKPVTESLMGFGLECGDGWFDIIDNACWLIQDYINNNRKNKATALKHNRFLRRVIKGEITTTEYFKRYYVLHRDQDAFIKYPPSFFRIVQETMPQFCLVQVKEKFGTLRLYGKAPSFDSYIGGVLRMAEAMSAVTCEMCGKPGKPTSGNWVKVRCEDCKDV